MSIRSIAVLLLAASAAAAEMPLPQLRVEPSPGGSVFYVKNVGSQPLTAFLIELVDYPGSSFALDQDEIAGEPIPPGVERRIPSSNMIVGAAPDYVKIVAAVYADGSSGGAAEKVTQIVEYRRATLATTRELIGRVERALKAGAAPAALAADLKQWGDSQPDPERRARYTGTGLERSGVKALIARTAASLESHSPDDVLAGLRRSERAMAAAKP